MKNQNELMQFIEKQRTFLRLLEGRVLRIDDTSLQPGFQKLLTAITEIENGKEFDIPGLLFLIDELIIYCDCIKNQLIQLKWWVNYQRSYIYKESDD